MTTSSAAPAPTLYESGRIQSIGALVGVELAGETVVHVGRNCLEILVRHGAAEDLFGLTVREVLGSTVTHALRNACGLPSILTRTEFLCFEKFGDICHEVAALRSGDIVLVEIGPAAESEPTAASILKDLAQLSDRTKSAHSPLQVITDCLGLLRTISGYEGVLVHKFHEDGTAEVVAESKRGSAESRLGARTALWSFAQSPRPALSYVSDITHSSVPVLSRNDLRLDLSGTNLCEAPSAQKQFLQSIGAVAAMTWVLGMDGSNWGALTFHHRRARIPTTRVRHLCQAFLPQLNAVLALRMAQGDPDQGGLGLGQ